MRYLVLSLALLWAMPAQAQRLEFDADTTYRVPIPASAPALGPDDALVTVVEFSDFYCGYCRRANGMLRNLLALYGDKIRLVFVHTPLDPEDGTMAAEASLAAQAQGQFWPMHDRLFAGPRGASRKQIERYARELGLDVAQFRRDLDGRSHVAALQSNIKIGNALGVRATPAFFVNGRPLIGALPMGNFVRVIDEEMAKAKKLVAEGRSPKEIYQAVVAGGKVRADGSGSEAQVLSIQTGLRYPVKAGDRASHWAGPKDAPVTLVEFSDLECPYCKRAFPILAALKQHYGDKLRIVFRHFPLAMHGHAQLAAEAAVEAGEQGKFWPFHDLVLRNQGALKRENLEAYASAVGLDMSRFRAALDSRRHMRAVLEDSSDGSLIGVRGTPTMFVNGTAVVGALPVEDFKKVIDAELALAEQLRKQGVAPEDIYKRAIEVKSADGKSAAKDTEDIDYHLATLVACRNGDAEQAKEFYVELKDKVRRKLLRSDCKRLGVSLPR